MPTTNNNTAPTDTNIAAVTNKSNEIGTMQSPPNFISGNAISTSDVHAVDQPTADIQNHSERRLGSTFDKLETVSDKEQPDNADIPLLNWHLKLNHMPSKALQRLRKHAKFRNLLQSVNRFRNLSFSSCADGKAQKAPHHHSEYAYKPGEKLFIDTVGPHSLSDSRNTTLVTIVDASTRLCISVPTTSRSKTKEHITRILNECQHIHGRYPRVLIADNVK